jgi:hypothetical protein
MSNIIICGDKEWNNYDSILNFVKTLDKRTTVIQGGRKGVDTLAKKACEACRMNCFTVFSKKSLEILDCGPVLVVAFHSNLDGSKGTKHIVNQAIAKQIPVKIFNI